MGEPIDIPPISLNELKEDPVWSKKGLVKANMQGVAGTPCTGEEYNALLSILKNKNFDISILPTLSQLPVFKHFSINYERDVEKYLLESFFKKAGII